MAEKTVVIFGGLLYNNLQVRFWACERSGPVRQGAVNHVRRGTEQH